MVNDSITRTAKRRTAILTRVFAELLSSESCRNDPLFIRKFRFLRQWWRRVVAGLLPDNERLKKRSTKRNNKQVTVINTDSRCNLIRSDIGSVSKCPNYLKMPQLSQNVPTHCLKMSKLPPEGKFARRIKYLKKYSLDKNQDCAEICDLTEFMRNCAENV